MTTKLRKRAMSRDVGKQTFVYVAALLLVGSCGRQVAPQGRLDGSQGLPHRLRGVHINHEDKTWWDAEKARREVKKLVEDWGVNVLRIHLDLTQEPMRRGTLAERLGRLLQQPGYKTFLEAVAGLDIWLVLDLFPRPKESGWPSGGWNTLWQNKQCQREFVEGWLEMGQRFRQQPKWIFDLLNEPEIEGQLKNNVAEIAEIWNELARTTVTACRRVGSPNIVLVEPFWGTANNFVYLRPLAEERVWYSFHFFHPHWFTHQGARGDWPAAGTVRYPGEGYGDYGKLPAQRWNKQALDKLLDPVRSWQRSAPHVRVLMGEGGCIVNAPSPDREMWLADMLDLMESNGWDWIVFAGPGFSLQDTNAEKVVRQRLKGVKPRR
ncbi:Endoglucanase C307 [bacterium HR36]|nr:Endoglucanase C307 [bacterium HR36]